MSIGCTLACVQQGDYIAGTWDLAFSSDPRWTIFSAAGDVQVLMCKHVHWHGSSVVMTFDDFAPLLGRSSSIFTMTQTKFALRGYVILKDVCSDCLRQVSLVIEPRGDSSVGKLQQLIGQVLFWKGGGGGAVMVYDRRTNIHMFFGG